MTSQPKQAGAGRLQKPKVLLPMSAVLLGCNLFHLTSGNRTWVCGRAGPSPVRPALTAQRTNAATSRRSRRTARSATQTAEADGEGIPRRLAIGAGVLAATLAGTKKFLIDGNMQELVLKAGSLTGKTIVITGGNTGLGLESAIRLAKAGATVVITVRTDAKGMAAVEEVKQQSGSSNVHYLTLDLADLGSVKAFASKFEKQPYGDHIDVLLNNAGVMAIPTRILTKDGFEMQFGTNHLGHFALVATVLPLLKKATSGARIVNVSSTAHLPATAADFQGDIMAPERYTQWGAYCTSKLANVLFSKELDRRFKAAGVPITAVSCHPGAINTDLTRWIIADGDAQAARSLVNGNPLLQVSNQVLGRPVNLGANTQVYLAAGLDGGLDKSGGMYFDNMAPGLENPVANDEAVAKTLWAESERLTGVKLTI
mmetsp:Transcript_29978/g.69750  ORF Transcript_29978/g.69750 Transcript_29978/m.69750 type:complete len:427 (+) Transcript_29978:92-1372(+)